MFVAGILVTVWATSAWKAVWTTKIAMFYLAP